MSTWIKTYMSVQQAAVFCNNVDYYLTDFTCRALFTSFGELYVEVNLSMRVVTYHTHTVRCKR